MLLAAEIARHAHVFLVVVSHGFKSKHRTLANSSRYHALLRIIIHHCQTELTISFRRVYRHLLYGALLRLRLAVRVLRLATYS